MRIRREKIGSTTSQSLAWLIAIVYVDEARRLVINGTRINFQRGDWIDFPDRWVDIVRVA